ncbi:hypothetical protein J3P71_10615 [Rhizobium leguminosarum]|uniref:hypothetical protein n=1 Tax=Rhizobium TaxID=379 RepID=UPI0014416899|nr:MULTISPECIES: hypothetical protein [Rhizobium]MBY3516738.1 hypothetical protein [Rhizobium laguerreae]MBY5840489.1 hypothetical protein [Rhizobium leguminosarum]NKM76168.1 hypothetical protein [Rhizobium leguminosarum bv. viciae]QSZ10164.1 hypothetical protein J3P71_10615 [Rhizobium leguminosarum]
MEPATFIVTTLAGAFLKDIAADTYNTIKGKLVDQFGLGKAVETVEETPDDEDAREFLAKKLAKSGALEDAEILSGVEKISAELQKLPNETPLGANLSVKDIKAQVATFRRLKIHGGGKAKFETIAVQSHLTVEDVEVGDDRKP